MIETGNIITETLSKAFEKMAFLMVMPVEEGMAIPEKTILAEIDFAGLKTGTIQILTSVDFSRILAANIGAGDQADEEVCRDALGELANVTCGLFLPMLNCSSQNVFDVTVPTVTCPENSSQWSEFTTDHDCVVLNVEGYLVAVKLTYKQA